MSSTSKQTVGSIRKKKRGSGPGVSAADVHVRDLWQRVDRAQDLYRASTVDRVLMVKTGVPARYTRVLATGMDVTKEKLYSTVGLTRATVDRKVQRNDLLNQDESERVMGLARLVGQVQNIVKESGETEDFDAAQWLATWLDRPLPALAGKPPGEFMDTADGRALVSDLLAQQQSGAYA